MKWRRRNFSLVKILNFLFLNKNKWRRFYLSSCLGVDWLHTIFSLWAYFAWIFIILLFENILCDAAIFMLTGLILNLKKILSILAVRNYCLVLIWKGTFLNRWLICYFIWKSCSVYAYIILLLFYYLVKTFHQRQAFNFKRRINLSLFFFIIIILNFYTLYFLLKTLVQKFIVLLYLLLLIRRIFIIFFFDFVYLFFI